MNAAEPERAWAPELPPELPWYEQIFPISERVSYRQRLGEDAYGRLAEWAVVQMRRVEDQWQRVAVYDICHGKGVHVHLYDREGREFTETSLRPVTCYQDVEDGLDYALERVTRHWEENERRSDRGY